MTSPDDTPLGIQLLGNNPYYLLKGLDTLRQIKFDLLDFNAACPQKKVTSKGKGAALLKNPRKLNQLLKLLVDNSPVPVTVKIRLGWDNASSALDIAGYARDAGIKAIFVHGRTKLQGYSGEVDYDCIRKIKKTVDIPVIASGNIFNAILAKKMFDETGCNAILIARGALGNPWIFKEISGYLENGELMPRPDIQEIISVMLSHLNSYIDFYGEKNGITKFRKFYIWYTRGISGVKPLRNAIVAAKTKAQMVDFMRRLKPFAEAKN